MSATPTWVPSAPGLVEDPTSGEYNFDEVVTYTQIYNGKYVDCVAGALPRGTLGSGITENYVVQSCRVSRASGERGRLVITWGADVLAILPGDEFGLDPQDLNPATEKNAAFNSVTPEQFRWCTTAVFNADDPSAAEAHAKIDDAGGQVKKLYDLLKRGVTNFYKPYFTYYWVQHFASEPGFNTGAVIESPGGPLAATIDGLGLACLREADRVEYANGIWRRTRRWKCTTDAYWESVLYP